MRYVRLLIPLVLLSLAVPAFAICGYCDQYENCTPQNGLYQRCRYKALSNCTVLCLEESAPLCDGAGFAAASASFSSGYRIMSVTVEDAKASPVKHESAVIPAKLKKTT